MQTCPKCGASVEEGVNFCAGCGNQMKASAQPVYTAPAVMYDPYDHTSEFDAKDISDNKVISMLVYLMGTVGIIIALLASSRSEYVGFHLRQALKITVVNILLGIIAAVTFFTFIIPIAAGIMLVVMFVIKIICFFQVCGGKAKEPAIIRNLTFLK
ncbi:MAG: zinc ribbon domain-containing protein [Monoglobales bacterium]